MTKTNCYTALVTRTLLIMTILVIVAGCAGSKRKHEGSSSFNFVDGQRRGDVVVTAFGLIESRYKYGGLHPSTGFDCSGLVAYVFNSAVAQSLPHNSAAIADLSRAVPKHKLKAGDFVFFNTLNRPFSHMGIYIGDGQFINAPSSGGRVRIDNLQNPYFAKRFESARTLFTD